MHTAGTPPGGGARPPSQATDSFSKEIAAWTKEVRDTATVLLMRGLAETPELAAAAAGKLVQQARQRRAAMVSELGDNVVLLSSAGQFMGISRG